ncbi:hypothetical protein Syun_023509 [Stephania yunnanensis]|uniref:Uncharacterized protein n=1 Tax=Stephania yunnanensis TaxID=152371 RepID=A0AAP0FN34_9MAGN
MGGVLRERDGGRRLLAIRVYNHRHAKHHQSCVVHRRCCWSAGIVRTHRHCELLSVSRSSASPLVLTARLASAPAPPPSRATAYVASSLEPLLLAGVASIVNVIEPSLSIRWGVFNGEEFPPLANQATSRDDYTVIFYPPASTTLRGCFQPFDLS